MAVNENVSLHHSVMSYWAFYFHAFAKMGKNRFVIRGKLSNPSSSLFMKTFVGIGPPALSVVVVLSSGFGAVVVVVLPSGFGAVVVVVVLPPISLFACEKNILFLLSIDLVDFLSIVFSLLFCMLSIHRLDWIFVKI